MRYVDPDGRVVETIWDVAFTICDVGNAIYKSTQGDHSGWTDVGIDALSIIIPGIPAGLSKVDDVVKASRGIDKALDASKTIDKASDGTRALKNAPAANGGIAPQHGGVEHNKRIDDKVNELLQDFEVTDIRKNQQQVDVNGNNVGKNRPDLQWTDGNGNRHYWEIDNNKQSSIKHGEVIKKNDSRGIVHLETIE